MPAGFCATTRLMKLGVAVRQLVGIVAALAGRLAHLVVAQIGEVGVVHLHVGAAGRGQRAQLVAVGVGDVLVERLEVGIVLAADAGAAAAEMQHGRRRDRHLRRAAGATCALEILEVGQLDVLDVAHLVDHAHHRRRELLGAVGLLDRDRDVGLHAAELLEEIDVEVGAAELAVGDALQADVFLELDDLGDRRRPRPRAAARRDLAAGALCSRASSRASGAGSCRRGRRGTGRVGRVVIGRS